ncbi:hypothetical protein DUNSADRAFT_9642 [Dunaliella salina]|uniref:Uncharacterized protein n=1 Tax=Dunaliella salina TaxID=3046 RepID=A0ABQ7GH13_DUNSA|nr:hypothetical protein DUNSADRAFT_9642 [Dunaliella salina]|eukprot:KAF5833895.1 hypothetical protein DUNSADRAFT_9642 [Dunaliella salina]
MCIHPVHCCSHLPWPRQIELPPDVDLQNASAVLKQAGPLQLTCPKKKHNDTQEQLQQLKAEALASNKMTVIPVELEVT